MSKKKTRRPTKANIKRTRKLTFKQKAFANEYLKNGYNATQASLKVYNIGTKHGTDDPEHTAHAIGSENLSKPAIRTFIEQSMAKLDINLENSLLPISKGLKAKKVVEVEGDYYETEVDDLNIQLKASDRALKLLGVAGESGGSLHLHLTDKSTHYNL